MRRNAAGRERNRGGERRFSSAAPAARRRSADPARLAAFETLRAVSADDAYANLVLPARLRRYDLTGRDAGFATELAYGALRAQGTWDAILERCVDRPLAEVDPPVLDALRIGVHQLLAMRVPAHAALDQTVALARDAIGAGPSGFINAVLRKVAERELGDWLDEVTAGLDDVAAEGLRRSHPTWIVRAFRQALVAHGRPVDELDELLAADNAAPVVNLVALPGLGDLTEVEDAGAVPGELVDGSATISAGDLGRFDSVHRGVIRVQDAGSQLVARALAAAPVSPRPETGVRSGDGAQDARLTGDTGASTADADGAAGTATASSDEQSHERRHERWLDGCAGPGGKAALLAALAAQTDSTLTANEPAPHRADLVRRALAPVPADAWEVTERDGRDIGTAEPAGYDRVLVDVPCSGLGALRRRPEARWRRSPADVAQLGSLQRDLLRSALAAVRPGGVVAYATCSPHPAETVAVVDDVLRARPDVELLDAPAILDSVALTPLLAGGLRGPDASAAEDRAVSGARGSGADVLDGEASGRRASSRVDGQLRTGRSSAGRTAQLWPHVHGTDAMFLALLRLRGTADAATPTDPTPTRPEVP